MTSNLGARDNENNNIGFGTSLQKNGEEDRAMKEFFKPELRNRIDQVCKFKRLDNLAIKKIVVKFLDELRVSVNTRGVRLSFTEDLVDYLAEHGYDSVMGARPLARKIDELIKVPLSKKLLFDNLKDVKIIADIIKDNVIFKEEFLALPIASINDNGIIEV